MKSFLEEYGMFIVYTIIGITLVGSVAFFSYNYAPLKEQVPKVENISAGNNSSLAGSELPTLEVTSSILEKGKPFYPTNYIVKAEDSEGNDLKNKVEIYDEEKVDVNTKGSYIVTYVLKDNKGLTTRLEVSFLVD